VRSSIKPNPGIKSGIKSIGIKTYNSAVVIAVIVN
jgi:hypothetical protein